MSAKGSNVPFQKELFEIVNGFGYEFKIQDKHIIIDLERKNDASKLVDKSLGKYLSHFPKQGKRMHKVRKKIRKSFSAIKVPFSKELIADTFLIAAFGYLSAQFILKFHNFFAVIPVLVSLGLLLKSLVCSVLYIFDKSDSEILIDYYGFSWYGKLLRAEKYEMVKKMEHSKGTTILSSTVFLSLSLSAYIFPFPLLIYTNEYVDILAFLIVIIYEITQYGRNLIIRKDIKKAFSSMFSALMAFVIFILYAVSLTQKYPTLTIMFSLILDLLVIFAVSKFVRELIQIRNLHRWIQSLS